MDFTSKTCNELRLLCKNRNINGYSKKKKSDLILMLENNIKVVHIPKPKIVLKLIKPEISASVDKKLKMIDLFAGTGAFTLAFENTKKVECVFANDMVKWSKEIYDINFSGHNLTLGDLNDIKVEDIPHHDLLTGGFPCFVAGTQVLTNNNYKNIEDVLLTDKLMTHKGNFQKILNLQKKQYEGELYKINMKCNMNNIICTPEHPFYVYNGYNTEPIWKPACDLTANDYIGMIINTDKINYGFIEGNYIWYSIYSITKELVSNKIDVYNFEVDIDNSYCVENVLVHNCQPFSIAGRQEGFQDKRSNVFWKILEIIDYHNPRFVVLENVKNLLSHDKGKTFEIIRTKLVEKGYYICYEVLNTSDVTVVPQHRERIYIVCIKSHDIFSKFTLEFPKILKNSVINFFEQFVDKKYYYTDKSSTWNLIQKDITEKNVIYQYRRVYVRKNMSNECPTLTANMGQGGHNVPLIMDDIGIRKLTPRECFNFQGFPDSYILPKTISDCNLYKLSGNAVSYPVVSLIAERLMSLI